MFNIFRIFKKTQKQSAGDNSSQNQLIGNEVSQTNISNQTNILYGGLVPQDIVKLTTTVSTQVNKQALSLCISVAEDVATKRLKNFEDNWIPRITSLENAREHLEDPKYQFMIRDADVTAIKSSRNEDLQMLTELLVCHIDKGNDLKVDAGIHRAIKIVHEVDNDALCALTVITALLRTIPVAGDILEGLKALDNLYKELLYLDLPSGEAWIEHLEVLGAIRTCNGNFLKLKDILIKYMDGYVCAGIKGDTEDYQKAIDILVQNGESSNALVENINLPGYYRLNAVQLSEVRESQQSIVSLYNHDAALLNTVKDQFMNNWDRFVNLKIIHKWFETVPHGFDINSVGRALAQTNAKRCYKGFPDLI